MCGICGIVSGSVADEPKRAQIERMRDTLVHRGPDGAGIHMGPGVGLGHRRLSIVDVAHGLQPMYSENRRYAIVYNGEVFNHPELKPQLEAQGVRYRTRSDTETVLHLFELYGDDSVRRMRGMFAFAIWDTEQRRLFLARDRFGVKPLYYQLRPDGGLVFGSEIKALLAATSASPSLNMRALPDFLANHAPSGDETLYEGVRRLPPGHTLTWQNGKVTLNQYWDLHYGNQPADVEPGSLTERKLVGEFRDRFTEAVRIRLMSDVPIGAFLSGGIDSAAITKMMASLSKGQVRTFSVAFAEGEANELQYARMVAEACNTQHREVLLSPEEFFTELPKLIWHEDEPIAHPSSVALYAVSKLASQHVKVVLTGEGSDETLAGYNRYRFTAYNARIAAAYAKFAPLSLRRGVSKAIGLLPPTMRWRQLADRTFLMRGNDLDDLYFDNFSVFSRAAQKQLLTRSAWEQVNGIDPYEAYHFALARVADQPLVSRLLYADTKTYLHELLMKQDQMSMAASVESRVPFLDHLLAEWVAALPGNMKLRGTTTKWILRAAMKDLLPAPILHRKKMGFPVPIGSWLRGQWSPLLDEYVTGGRLKQRTLFEPHYLDRLVDEHKRGINHSERLWALITFEIWARMTLDGDAPEMIRVPMQRAA